ncbi:MAG TPA: amidohydrolase family protein [Terriglobales bacterium]
MIIVLIFAVFSSLAVAEDSQTLLLTGAKVYPSPTDKPIEGANVLIVQGKIARVDSSFIVPKGARVIDCKGKVIVAGFWNSHVHFTEGVWQDAGGQSVEKLEFHMQEMLTKWGVTTVWDLGSDPPNTITLRKRIEAGEVRGPKIFMAGDIFPLGGHPVYLPAEIELPEAGNAAEASLMARGYLSMGLDGIKLFTGSFMGDKPPVNMPTPVVKAAVDVAHAQGKPVFAHPQNYAGVDNALAGGVDVLAHTIPTAGHYTDEELAAMKRQHTALTPTLTLWTTVVPDVSVQNQLVDAGVGELKQFFSQGGTVLFGTDVGFIDKYDTMEEYEFMGRAMPWQDVLASLTTNPSAYFKAPSKGKVEKGMDADLVVLDADPAADVKNLAKVAYTIRGGKIIYQEK